MTDDQQGRGSRPDTGPDDDLERAFRDGLRRRAEAVDVPPDLLARVRTDRHRRRTAVLAGLGAAAAVAVAVAVVQVLPTGDDGPTPVADRSTTGGPTPTGRATADSSGSTGDASVPVDPGAPPAGSRFEVWHGLQVTVPSDWGWGTAVVGCAYGAQSDSTGQRVTGTRAATTPYVGRPVLSSDVCSGRPPTPQAPYVWLGADLEPGTVDVGNGYTQQTVAVDGTTLTVGATDAATRQEVIDSATTPACPTSITRADLPQGKVFGSGSMGDPVWVQLCDYHSGDGGPTLDLAYADRLDAQAASSYLATLTSAPAGDYAPNPSCRTSDLAVLRFAREDQETRQLTVQQVVVDLGCNRIELGAGETRSLDLTTALTIAGTDGLSTVVGPTLREPIS